jgi:hypothetical protein
MFSTPGALMECKVMVFVPRFVPALCPLESVSGLLLPPSIHDVVNNNAVETGENFLANQLLWNSFLNVEHVSKQMNTLSRLSTIKHSICIGWPSSQVFF